MIIQTKDEFETFKKKQIIEVLMLKEEINNLKQNRKLIENI